MRTPARSIFSFLFVFLFSALFSALHAQSNSGVVSGVVTDPSGAVVPGATVSIQNPVSQYTRTATTDKAGHFQFPNVPFNPYHLTVAMTGFSSVRAGCRRPLGRSSQLDHPAPGQHGDKHRDGRGW